MASPTYPRAVQIWAGIALVVLLAFTVIGWRPGMLALAVVNLLLIGYVRMQQRFVEGARLRSRDHRD